MKQRILGMVGSLAVIITTVVIGTPPTAVAQEYTVRLNSYTGPATMYVSPAAVRKSEPGFKTDVIYRLAEGKIISIDHEKKTYTEVTLTEERQKNAQAAAHMSPQLKAMMNQMGLNTAPSFTKLGTGGTIAGYATEKYLIKTPAATTEIWAAPALGVPAAYYEVFRTGAGPGAWVVGGGRQGGETMKNIAGMILKRVSTTTLLNGQTLTEEATAVDTSSIPSSMFAPPAGYTKVPSKSDDLESLEFVGQ